MLQTAGRASWRDLPTVAVPFARRLTVYGVAAVGIAVLGSLPVSAASLSAPVAQLYGSVSIFPPSASAMTVCYGFVCRRRETLNFSAADRRALANILAAGRSSATAERTAVQRAVVWFDRRVGPVIGTNKRVARADFRAGDDKHNFDCWDTTRNTTSLLLVLQGWKLLKFHTIGDPRYRGNVIALQTPHNTAVLVERSNRSEWVVDLWPRGYGQKPDVMPVANWEKEN